MITWKKFREHIGYICLHIVSFIWFERFIFLSIFVSSLFLALSDYNCVDNNNDLISSCSIRNRILIDSEIIFVVIFTSEFVLKAIAFGLFYSPYFDQVDEEIEEDKNKNQIPKPYFLDYWNWLDFVVVVFAILSITSTNSSKLNILRVFKVLRPLKAIRSLPGVAAIVSVLLLSIPQMIDILLAILFSFYIFSIIGLQVFGGPYLHTRCRLTPFPVNNSWIPTLVPKNITLMDSINSNITITTSTYLYDYNEYRCIDGPNFDTQSQYPNWGKSDSPWYNSHPDCYWPVDNDNVQNCALPMTSGDNHCLAGLQYGLSEFQYRWCGSNYDAVGNPRFSSDTADLDTYIPNLFYGFIKFDNVGYSFIYVIQVISGDNWSTIMFQLFNSVGVIGAAIFCCFIIIYGTFFLLQLNVAVLQRIFTDKNDEDVKEKRRRDKRATLSEKNKSISIRHPVSYNRLDSDSNDNNDDLSPSLDNGMQLTVTNDVINSPVIIDSDNNSTTTSNYQKDGEIAISDPKNNCNNNNDELNENMTPPESPNTVNTRHVIQQLNENLEKTFKINRKQKSNRQLKLLKLATVAPTESSKDNESSDLNESIPFVIINQESVPVVIDDNTPTTDKPMNKSPTKNQFPEIFRESSIKSFTTNSDDHTSAIDKAAILINKWDRPDQNHFRRMCYDLSHTKLFQHFFTALIIINTVLLAVDHYPESDEFFNVVDLISFFLTILFAIEMVIILLGQGIVEYCKDSFNIMDALIVVISMIEIFVSPLPILLDPNEEVSKSGAVIALRSFRLFRVLKLFRSQTFQRTLVKVLSVVYSMRDFLMILIIFLFILALAGMQIFANQLRFDSNGFPISAVNSIEFANAPDRPRSNFDNFTIAFLTIFQIVTIDNWSIVMFNCARSLGPGAMAFAIFCFFMGTFFLTNLFLALLVDRFANHNNENDSILPSESSEIVQKDVVIPISNDDNSNFIETSNSTDNLLSELGLMIVSRSGRNFPYKRFKDFITQLSQSSVFNRTISFFVCLSTFSLAFDNPLLDPSSNYVKAFYIIDCVVTAVFLLEMVIKFVELGIYSDKNAYFRNGWNILDFFVVIVCVLSLIQGSVGDRVKSLRSIRALKAIRTLRLIHQFTGLRLVFTSIILSLPAITQIGFIVFLIYFIFAIFFTSFLKGQLQSCQNGLFQSNQTYMNLETYPMAWNDLSFEQKEWFGPSGLVSPTYLTSNCSDIWPEQSCCFNLDTKSVPTSREICECWGGQWLPVTDFRFDNVAMSLLTLFDDGTIDNWSENMHYVSDSRGIDMEPVRDSSIIWYYVFFVFIIIGNFLCIQLFIGAITKSFNDHKVEVINGGSAFLTKEQHEWINTTRLISQVTPTKKAIRPKDRIRGVCFDICSHWLFDPTVMLCVICQCILLSITYFGQSDTYSFALQTVNTILTCVFGIEVTIKLVGLGVKNFFSNIWNLMDFLITIASAIILIRLAITGDSTGLLINLVRTLRLIRVLSLLDNIESLKRLVDCMIYIIPALTNICILLVFAMYIFDVIGVQLFAKVAYYGTYTPYSNFRSFGFGMITLFRMTTADNWGQLMYDSTYRTDGCVDDPPYNASYCGFNNFDGCIPLNGCGTYISYPFWIIYIILMTFILLSVFISIIISTYHQIKKGDIRQETIDIFSNLWKEYDPKATSYIRVVELKSFVASCCFPFGFEGKKFSERQYHRRVNLIQIYFMNGEQKVHFRDVIIALSHAHFERSLRWEKSIVFSFINHSSYIQPKSSIERFFANIMGKIASVIFLRENEVYTVQHLLAVQKIQQIWKDKLDKLKQVKTKEDEEVIVEKRLEE